MTMLGDAPPHGDDDAPPPDDDQGAPVADHRRTTRRHRGANGPAVGVPPHDLDAERALVGAVLVRNAAWDDAVDQGVRADDFYGPAHAHVWAAITRLVEAGHVADPVLVAHDLQRDGTIDAIGGPATLLALQAAAPGTGSAAVARLASIVVGLARLRAVQAAAAEVLQLTATAGIDPDAAAARAEQIIQTATDRAGTIHAEPLSTLVPAWVGETLNPDRDDPSGLPTPWTEVNRSIGGFRPGQLIVPCARPGVGKTAWALNVAVEIASGGYPVLFASLEMSKKELLDRLHSHQSGVTHTSIRDRTFGPNDFERIGAAAEQTSAWPLRILDDGDATLAAIGHAARRIPDLAVLIIDYLQLIKPPDGGRRWENRQTEVADISRGLKRLARRLRIPVIALAQLNRDTEARDDKRPRLGDLRESGQIENDADLVIGLYRDELYKPKKTRDKGVLEQLILKQRNGPYPRTIRTGWIAQTGRITNLASQEAPDDDDQEDF